jgi:hypothetical protein
MFSDFGKHSDKDNIRTFHRIDVVGSYLDVIFLLQRSGSAIIRIAYNQLSGYKDKTLLFQWESMEKGELCIGFGFSTTY